MLINDVGQNTWEEIDDGSAGANYGWPIVEGPNPPNLGFTYPRYAYDHSIGCAITGGTFYDPPVMRFPLSYAHDYFFADFCGNWIKKLDLTTNTVTDFATGIPNPVDLKVGADGALYYLARGIGSVYRVTAIGSSLLINFGAGDGVWTRSGSVWSLVHSLSPELMTVGDLDGNGIDEMIFDFGAAYGLWAYYNKTTWAPLHPFSPSLLATADLDNNGRDDLMIGFPGFGTYVFYNNTTWTLLTNLVATRVAAGNVDQIPGDDLVVDLPGAGIWMWRNNSAWQQLHAAASNALVVADIDGSGKADVIISFPGQGIWSYMNDAGWARIHSSSSTHIAAGNLKGNASKDLVIDFGAAGGLWIYRDASVFEQLHPFAAEQVAIGDFDGNGLDDIAIDFGASYGLWLWTNNAWTQLHGLSPVDMTFTDLS